MNIIVFWLGSLCEVDGRKFFFNMDLYSTSVSFVEARYGYAVASALHGVQHILRKDFMLQVSLFLGNLFVSQLISGFAWIFSKFLIQHLYMHILKLFLEAFPCVIFSAPLGLGNWKKVHYSLHLWM